MALTLPVDPEPGLCPDHRALTWLNNLSAGLRQHGDTDAADVLLSIFIDELNKFYENEVCLEDGRGDCADCQALRLDLEGEEGE